MQYNHDKDQASTYSAEALARVRHETLAPTPNNYELWYIYYSGQSPEVVKAIETLISNKNKITDERCQEIYQRYISEARSEESIRRAGNKINSTIQNVTGVVKEVRASTNEYSGKLDKVDSQIDQVEDADALKGILSDMVSDTHKMLAENQKLEAQLDISSEVMGELQRDLESVRKEAMTDGLTGLKNRKSFDENINRMTEQTKKSGRDLSLLMIDIDHFKNFNDKYGHQVGDQVLRLVARTLLDGVKGRDIAARYGGEEFSIILPETDLKSALHVANTLRKSVATKDVINRNSGQKLGRITMSVGVAQFLSTETSEDLISRADTALYQAKNNGRNQVVAMAEDKKLKAKTAQ